MATFRLQHWVLAVALGASAEALAAAPTDPQDQAHQQGDTYYGCGKPKPIDGYEITFQGARLHLPRFVQINEGSRTLFADEKTSGWEPPYNSARYATVGDMLVIVTAQTDCIDLDHKRLFVVQDHRLLLHQTIWTGNWRDGFFIHEGRLSYWSEWFCRSENNDRKAGQTFIYSLARDSKSFERVDVKEKRLCAPVNEPRLFELREFELLKK